MAKERKPSFTVRRIRRGYWTYDLHFEMREEIAVGEVHGNERDARRRARAALKAEMAVAENSN